MEDSTLTSSPQIGAEQSNRPNASALRLLHDEFVGEQRFATRLSSETLRGYRQSFAVLLSVMPTLSAAQLTSSALTEFFRRLETRKRWIGRKERRGVKSSTIATYRSKLNRFFAWLAAKGHIAANPFASMPYPRVEYEDRKYLSRAAVERIFAALVLAQRSHNRVLRTRNVAIFATLLYTGIRRGELLGLRLTDLDLKRLELTVRAETSKSRLRRIIPINSRLCIALEDYLDERSKLRLPGQHLFTDRSGRNPLTREGLKHLIQQTRRRSGVRFHAHQFRHTFAVNFLNRGGDVAKLKQLLGHRDIRMTSAYLRCLPTTALRNDVESITLDTLL